MKIKLTYKEANLLNAIIWELGQEGGVVVCPTSAWRLSTEGAEMVNRVADKLEEANNKANKTDRHRDLSGSPKGTILDAGWSA